MSWSTTTLIKLPQNIDVVFNVLYYHDLPLNKIDTAALNAKILKALKPGGIYFIVDHNARPGSGTRRHRRSCTASTRPSSSRKSRPPASSWWKRASCWPIPTTITR